MPKKRTVAQSQNRSLLVSLCAVVALGIAAAIFHISGTTHWPQTLALVVLVAGASGLCGTLLGFLFGIPRTTVEDGAGPLGRAEYRPNTSLEQISDWLTKILVGVGLTQLGEIPDRLSKLASHLVDGYPAAKPNFMLAVLLYSGALGFLLGYIATRVYLAPLFRQADAQLAEQLEQAQAEVQQMLDLKQSVLEVSREMMQKLYNDPPKGFEQAIALGEALRLQRPKLELDESFWLRLACAYAQRYAWEVQQGLKDEASATRIKVFDAIDRMIAVDPRAALLSLSTLSVKDPTKPADEDDFEIFASDPDFAARIQRARSASPTGSV